MAPNLLVKAAFVQRDFDSSKTICDGQKSIRTDFILQNIFSHLIKSGGSFEAIPAANKKEENILIELQEIVDAFKSNYVSAIQGLCSEIEFASETLHPVLLGVSNELFCEGITWSRIVALFVFVGELTLQCLAKDISVNVIDLMYESFCRLVKENLTGWVEDHEGWEGIRSLSNTQGNSNQQITENVQTPSRGWAKSLLHGTVRMIGTLAQIANTPGQTFP